MKTLFQGGLVFDGKGKTHDGVGVLVEDGRITAFAPRADFAGYDGAIVDTTDGTLLPG